MSIENVLPIFFAGVVATIILDFWQLLVQFVLGIPRTNWANVGRWICNMPRGIFINETITKSSAAPFEATIGWITHYVVGLIYAAAYTSIILPILDSPPSLISALLFGVATVAAPWFIMQPGMGLGIMASKSNNPQIIRIYSLSCHIIFGAGLYFGLVI